MISRAFQFPILTLLILASAARAQTVRLMARATAADTQVRLGDIAVIEDATPAVKERVAQTVILEKLDGSKVLDAQQVMFAILQNNQDLPLAPTLVIRGAAQCTVTLEGTSPPIAAAPGASNTSLPAPLVTSGVLANEPLSVIPSVLPSALTATPAAAPIAASPPEAASTVPAADSAAPLHETLIPGSLADLLTRQIITDFAASPADLDVKFPLADPAIRTATPAGQQWVFHPMMAKTLGTMQWEARLLKDNVPVRELWVQATIRRRVTQVLAAVDIQRGVLVTPDMVRAQTVWPDRQMPDISSNPADVIGMEAVRPMAAGSPIKQHDFQVADAVRPDDVVSVYFINGGIRVKSTAKALTRGRLHDRVKIQNDDNKIFEATVIGMRLAVVGDIDEATEQQLREAK